MELLSEKTTTHQSTRYRGLMWHYVELFPQKFGYIKLHKLTAIKKLFNKFLLLLICWFKLEQLTLIMKISSDLKVSFLVVNPVITTPNTRQVS